MILIITSEDDLTCDYVILELRQRGLSFHRLNTEHVATSSLAWSPREGVSGHIAGEREDLSFASITSVWYRRPKAPCVDHDDGIQKRFIGNEWSAVLDNLWASLCDVLWVSSPDRIRVAARKIPQLQLATRLGLSVPATIISNDTNELQAFFDRFHSHVACKVLHDQTPNKTGDAYLVYTTLVSRDELIPDMMGAPIFMQEYIEKQYEVRATVVGTRVFSVAIDSQALPEASIDWRRATLELNHRPIELPAQVNDKLVAMVQHYGLQFGAFDLIQTPSGDIVFLELNPNGQWAWIQQITGIPIREALVDLLAKGRAS